MAPAETAQFLKIAPNVAMSAQIYVGLTTSSHQKTSLHQVTLDKVAVTKNLILAFSVPALIWEQVKKPVRSLPSFI